MKESNSQIEPDEIASDFIVPLISMDRLQATCTILYYLLRNCFIWCRNKSDPISSKDILYMVHDKYHGCIQYINMNANNFHKYMKFFGAIWWYDQFLTDYVDECPECVELYSSFILLSDPQTDYIVVTNESIFKETIVESDLNVIIDMENKYGFLSSLVDGYMWAQNCERHVTKVYECSNDIDVSYEHGFDYVTGKACIEFGLTEQDLLVHQIP